MGELGYRITSHKISDDRRVLFQPSRVGERNEFLPGELGVRSGAGLPATTLRAHPIFLSNHLNLQIFGEYCKLGVTDTVLDYSLKITDPDATTPIVERARVAPQENV